MRRIVLAAVLLVACLLAAPVARGKGPPRVPPLGSTAKRELLALFERYFEASEADRPAILAEVRKRDPVPASAVRDLRRRLFKRASRGLRTDGKTTRTLDHPDFPGRFIIRGAKRGREKALLIGLHGGGQGAGDGATSAQKWAGAQGKGCICVFPTVIRKEATAWNKEREERYVLALIDAVKRSYRVDTNRIYLVGHSMGGFGTWSIGAHHADLFAAISPNAGGVFVRVSGEKVTGVAPGILPNLHNLPVYFTHGADDRQVAPHADRAAAKALAELAKEHPGGYLHEYHEYPDIGHGLPPKGPQPIIEWLVRHRRDPYPRKVVWEPVLSWKRTFYWVRLERPAGAGRLVAVNHGDNRFEVTTAGGLGGRGLSLLLADDMVDARKPVTVTVDGEEAFAGFALPSAAALLESIAERNDRRCVFTARIDL
jgi:predicted esterase